MERYAKEQQVLRKLEENGWKPGSLADVSGMRCEVSHAMTSTSQPMPHRKRSWLFLVQKISSRQGWPTAQ